MKALINHKGSQKGCGKDQATLALLVVKI